MLRRISGQLQRSQINCPVDTDQVSCKKLKDQAGKKPNGSTQVADGTSASFAIEQM